MCILRTLQNSSLLAASSLGNLFHSLGTNAGNFALCTLLCIFLVTKKVNWTQIAAFSLVYTLGSDDLDTVVLFGSVF